ncbi:MAG: hypothetical protein LBI42_15320 [Chitinispirillales bacterium]|jgi:hypothetical protein|nr:hypothetical protein [Chitinispirillales bacterium]
MDLVELAEKLKAYSETLRKEYNLPNETAMNIERLNFASESGGLVAQPVSFHDPLLTEQEELFPVEQEESLSIEEESLLIEKLNQIYGE